MEMEAVIIEKDCQIQAPNKLRPITTLFRLSAGQKGLYILQKLHPKMGAYNVPFCLKIHGPLNRDLLAQAWTYVLEQFPILTATIIEEEGELYHRLDDGCKTTIQQRMIDFADDLELVSFVRDNQKSVLLFTVHHIIFDGTSGIVLVRALFEFYRRLLEHKTILPMEDGVSYQEFVAAEEEMLATARGAVSARYWQQQLDGDLPVLELPSDLPRVASASLEARTLIENVPEDIALWIRDFARTHSLRPSVIFLTIFQLLLHRYTSQDDMIVGMAVNTRVAQKFKAEIGYFVNMVPIRTRFEGRITFSDLLRRVQGIMMDALSHSSYPYPLMLEKLKVQQARNNPIFQVTYAYHDFVKEASFAPLWDQLGLNVESVKAIVQEGEQDLGVEIFEQEMSFILHLKYNPEIYAERTATRFI